MDKSFIIAKDSLLLKSDFFFFTIEYMYNINNIRSCTFFFSRYQFLKNELFKNLPSVKFYLKSYIF